jgi:hypothetical protein
MRTSSDVELTFVQIGDQGLEVSSGLIDINRIWHKANQADQEPGGGYNPDICH